MSFGSFGAGFGSFGSGVGGLLPSFTNLTDWLRTPTSDGKTLSNSQGTDPELTDVNVLGFDGVDDRIALQTVPSDLLQGVFNIEFDILIDDTDTSYQRFIWFLTSGNAFFRMQKNLNVNTFDFWARNSSSGTLFRNQGLAFTPDVLFNFKAIGDGTDVKVYYNDVLQSTISINNSNKESGFAPPSPTIGSNSFAFLGRLSNFKMSSGGVLHTHLPLAEGSGTKAYDVSGNGNHGTITSATWEVENSIASWNHQYGFDTDKFKGYSGYWDLANSASGTWTIGESSLSLTGNSGSSSRIRQTVNMDIGASLVVSGTVVQTGGSQGGEDLAISSSSVGWAQGSVFLGGAAGTYTFSTSLTAISNSCDVQFIGLNGVTLTIRDIKFTVVKKIPALNTKTKQVATFDGVADQINTGYNPSGDLIIDARIKADSVTGQKIIHQCNENAGYFFRISDGEWQLYVGNGYVFSSSTGIDPVVGTLYDTRVEYTASSNAWVVKVKVATDSTYTTVGSGTRTPAFSSANFILGQKGSSMFFDGEYHSFKITDGGATKVEYDFQSDIGTSTVQDLSTNNNDGTVTTGSGGTATFWGTRVADTAGSLVSADYNVGNLTISNPGGFVHNGSECGIDLPDSKTASDLFQINNSTATTTFVRKDNGNILQVLQYSSPLTGDDLTRTRNYVG